MVGALPSQHIRDLIRKGHIKNGNEKNIQPASLDLTVANKIYRLPYIFLPKSDQRVEDVLMEIGAEEMDFNHPLEKNIPYIVKLWEELALPHDVYAYSNPKSSVGRIDLRVTMLADFVSRFDAAGEKGYKGELWAIIEPKSFRVKIQPGDTLLQLRLFYGDSRFGEEELATFFREWNPLYLDDEAIPQGGLKISDRDGGLIMTVDMRSDFLGWRCEGTETFLDFSKRGFYAPEEFFTPIQRPATKRITLRKGDFYILYTRERLRVPPYFAAEIAPLDVRSGEYRTHYAGFIDP
ncbi:MAG: 2'-deoxycytidine 5'-triphosphate deaminase, partial [Patescibacteria group bacterium]